MKTITFTAYNNAGAPLGTAVVEGIVLYGTDFFDEAWNQSTVYTADGDSYSYGNNIKRSDGIIILAGVSDTDGIGMRTWLRDTLQFQANYVGIGLASADVNIGKGNGIDIVFADRAKYKFTHGKSLSKISAPKIHKVRFPYNFKR